MKILILQLARLGDIYQSWPTFRAAKRQNPGLELHALCRPRFKEAFAGLDEVDQLHHLPTQDILRAVIEETNGIESSISEVHRFIEGLKAEKFDKIVNLSYSPLSSYLSYALAEDGVEVSGYTRFNDGFLSIPDDTSAYFSAQVGHLRSNRIHLADLFAMTMDLDLLAEDWKAPSYIAAKQTASRRVCLHIGASQYEKMYPVAHWKKLVGSLLESSDLEIALIGSFDEQKMSDFIMKSFSECDRLKSYVGQSSLTESMQIIADSALLIGADSGPIHMASLVDTPTLNISSDRVNFWETGPQAAKSCVVVSANDRPIDPEEIVDLALSMVDGQMNLSLVTTAKTKAIKVSGQPSYETIEEQQSFSWDLLKALYIGGLFPEVDSPQVTEAMVQLGEANNLILQQIADLKRIGHNETSLSIMARGEEVIEAIGQIVPELGVLIRWYQTEKLRLGPENFSAVLEKTEAIHVKLSQILSLYLMDETIEQNPAMTQEGNIADEADSIR